MANHIKLFLDKTEAYINSKNATTQNKKNQ